MNHMANFINKHYLVKNYCLKATSTKCNQDSNNVENPFYFNLASWDVYEILFH
jgi:hypothetical protein